jgi:hypothetical protein
LLEGLIAGLVGGAVFVVVAVIADALTRGGDLFYTVSRMGALFTGMGSVPQTGATPLGTPFLVGALVLLALFAMIGVGFISYLPIVFRLGISKALFGAIYGVFFWLLFFVLMLGFVNGEVAGSVNIWVMLVSCVLAGAAMGWTLGYLMSRKGGASYGQPEQAGYRQGR